MLSVHVKSVKEQQFFHKFAFDNNALKTFLEFSICWKRWKFERRRIQIRTSSQPYLTSILSRYPHRLKMNFLCQGFQKLLYYKQPIKLLLRHFAVHCYLRSPVLPVILGLRLAPGSHWTLAYETVAQLDIRSRVIAIQPFSVLLLPAILNL